MAFQVRAICRDHGVVCVRREGKDIEKIIAADDILCENKVCQFMKFFMVICYWYIYFDEQKSIQRKLYPSILSFLDYLNCGSYNWLKH